MKTKYLAKIPKVIFDIILLVIFLVPFYWLAITSIKSLSETLAWPPKFIVTEAHFENFVEALSEMDFPNLLKNSIIVTVGVLVAQLVTVVPAAYAFARMKFKGKKIMFGMMLATMMVPAQLVFLPIFILLSKWNLVNTYWSLILPQATSAFGIFMLRQNFMQIPEELIEAAKLDKAGEFKIIYQVMLPIARPTVVTLAMLTFISSWNDYFWPMVLTTKDTVRTLPVGITSLMSVDGGIAHNVVMAGNVILIIPILIVFLIAHKQIISAFSYMGVK